jgi:redox-sensitive bicupin YhaK (pirin superfamily)
MTYRTVKFKAPAQKVNMGGHFLDQPLPTGLVDYVDPFLLIHHWKNELPGGQREKEAGVGPHPHRGFSPVTFVYKGEVVHRDSLGEQATVGPGGTQWMFAGRGITHSERFGKELSENGGELEFIQFWVNTPSEHKLKAPFYMPISEADTPKIEREGHTIWVVSGTLDGVHGAAETYSPQLLLRSTAEAGAKIDLNIPKSFNCLVYLLDGKVKVDAKTFQGRDMVVFENDADAIQMSVLEKTRFIVLSGEPLNEPVESYGPFVMTNQTEVMQAIRDAQMGKMGVLIEEFED